MTPIPIGKHFDDLRRSNIRDYCSHPEAAPALCAKEIIRAHTIPRSGGLAKIAEKGHVYSVKAAATAIYENEGRLIPSLVGVRSASTFGGFCGKHDSEMFRPIEHGTPALDLQTCFLMSFRAISYELFQKKQALQGMDVQRKTDYGKPFAEQAFIQTSIHNYAKGVERGLSDLQAWKDRYDSVFKSQTFGEFSFFAVQFDKLLPVAACGAFHPEISFRGERLQILSRGTVAFDHVTVTLLPFSGGTAIVFGWLDSESGPAVAFARSFAEIPDDQKANAAVHLAFEHLENTYLNPNWWKNVPEDIRASAIRRFSGGTGLRGYWRDDLDLSDRGAQFVAASVRDSVAKGFAL